MSQRRRYVFVINKERIEQLYVSSAAKGLEQPVILVLDLEDEFARSRAELLVGKDEVAERTADVKQKGDLGISILRSFSHADAMEVLAGLSESGAEFLNSVVGTDRFAVAIIGDGGISWAKVDIPQ